MGIFSSAGNLRRLACLARRISNRALWAERARPLGSASCAAESCWDCSCLLTSLMFTLSGSAWSAGLDCLGSLRSLR
jgi:hypothetical protein